jgi:hypothetical protein
MNWEIGSQHIWIWLCACRYKNFIHWKAFHLLLQSKHRQTRKFGKSRTLPLFCNKHQNFLNLLYILSFLCFQFLDFLCWHVHWHCVLYYVFVDILLTILYFLQAICSYSDQGSFGSRFNSHSFLSMVATFSTFFFFGCQLFSMVHR